MTDYEISCGICMDLLPLVADGVACEDSRLAVERHIAHCENCRAQYEAAMRGAPPPSDGERVFTILRKKMWSFWSLVLVFGTLYGISLTATGGLFCNILLMPAIGALGYVLFGGQAVYRVPLLLFFAHLAVNLSGLSGEVLSLAEVLMWTGLYCLFALVGFLIAWLLHFALKKEDDT